MAKEKDHELLWQTRRRDPNCNSGGRFAAVTVMNTTIIPTRSGDGTFILEFVPSQYTLFSASFSGQFAIILAARLTSSPARIYRAGAGIGDELLRLD
jgi:hypothetical protein